MKHIIFVLFITFFIVTTSKAEEAPYISEKVDTFFINLKNNPDDVIDNYFGDSVFAKENQDTIRKIKAKLSGVLSQIGKYHKSELIIRRHLLNRYISIKYLAMFDRQPLTFQFEFYKPNKKWKIQGLTFNSNIDDLLDEAINYGIIKKIRIDSGDK